MGNCLEPEPQPQPARRRPKPQQPNSPSKRPPASNARDQPTGRIESPSAPISSPISKNNNFKRDEIVLGSSVSERREIDNDRRWKQLLDKTTTNLIDISQTTQPLDGVDAQQREVEHKTLIANIRFQDETQIFSLPAFNISEETLSQDITPHDKEFMQKSSHELTLALSNLTVEHQGDIVVSFGSLQ